MAEVASFGNIVSSLVTLRQSYHEQLKSFPQYEAYLLVQSSTEKAAGALQANADGPASIAAEVIDSLQFARSRFEHHLNSVPEYRTLLAMDKLIQDISIDLGVARPTPASAPEITEAETPEAATVEPVVSAAETEAEEAEEPEVAKAAELDDVAEQDVAEDLADDLAVAEHDHDIATSAEADAEADPVVATVDAVEAETRARPPVESPLTPSRMTVDLDEALADDDDIVSVHVPQRASAIEGGEDDELLDISHRATAKTTTATSAKDADEEAA